MRLIASEFFSNGLEQPSVTRHTDVTLPHGSVDIRKQVDRNAQHDGMSNLALGALSGELCHSRDVGVGSTLGHGSTSIAIQIDIILISVALEIKALAPSRSPSPTTNQPSVMCDVAFRARLFGARLRCWQNYGETAASLGATTPLCRVFPWFDLAEGFPPSRPRAAAAIARKVGQGLLCIGCRLDGPEHGGTINALVPDAEIDGARSIVGL